MPIFDTRSVRKSQELSRPEYHAGFHKMMSSNLSDNITFMLVLRKNKIQLR
jgi:hypothetical protein